jgi:hypothetical protein
MLEEIIELIEFEGGTILKFIIVFGVIIAILGVGYNMAVPHKAVLIPTPVPHSRPTIGPVYHAPTPTPLPSGYEYINSIGEFGPNRQLVFNLSASTPAKYDPAIGDKDDNVNMAMGLGNNLIYIPAYDSTGQVREGYYDTQDNSFHYVYANGSIITQITPIAENKTYAMDTNTYSLVGEKVVNGRVYGYDTLGNWIELNGSYQAVSINNYTVMPSTVGGLNL